MNKYLIFRTDRIGDFLISAILIKCIKKNDPNSKITLVGSKNNSSYIRYFDYVDEVIELENNIFKKLRLIYKLRRYKFTNIIVHDNKKRSKFITFFLKSKNKIFLGNNQKKPHINIIQHILKKMNFEYYQDSLDLFNYNKLNKPQNNELIQLHFDEKWINDLYINKFTNIEPSERELIDLVKTIKQKTNKDLIITTGILLPKILNKIEPDLFKLNIRVYEKLDFLELEKITSNSKILISCHGAISHVAAAYKIKQIDIIDRGYDYSKWTNHFRNYNSIYREKFSELSKNIISKI